MSCSRQCLFYKAVDSKWYLQLGNHEYAYEDWQCTTYGPFVSQEAADNYLYECHSNPGGAEIDSTGMRPVPVEVLPV